MSSRDFNVEESYDDIMTKGLKSLKKIELHNQHNCKPNPGGTRLRERLESGRDRDNSEEKGFGTLFIKQQDFK